MHTCPKVHYICASVSALLLSRLQHTQLPPRAKAHIQPYWDNAQIALLNRAPSVKRQWMGGGFMYWLSKSEKSLYFNGLQFYIQFPIKPNQTILNPFSFFSLWIYFENSPLFLSVYFHLICSKLLDTVLGFRSINLCPSHHCQPGERNTRLHLFKVSSSVVHWWRFTPRLYSENLTVLELRLQFLLLSELLRLQHPSPVTGNESLRGQSRIATTGQREANE